MREIKNIKKTNFIKKILIKICRIFGYELIDQSTLAFPVSNKKYGDLISIPGNKSISLGVGGISITRKVDALDIIVKTPEMQINKPIILKNLIFSLKNKIDKKIIITGEEV